MGLGCLGSDLSPIPVFERQVLSPNTLIELRRACALILKETSPSETELDTIINQPDPLATYERDLAKVRAQAATTHQSSFPPIKAARYRDKQSMRDGATSANKSSSTLPLNSHRLSSSAFKSTSTLPSSDRRSEPYASNSNPPSTRPKHKPMQVKEDDALASIRVAMSSRPKTSAAACVDYGGPSGDSSTSSTRSNTTLDHRVSTGMTSFAQTPANEKRISSQFPPRTSSRNDSTQAWMVQDSNQRQRERDLTAPNPDYSVPTLYHPRPTSRQSARQYSRSRSRASSIKENILGGIRDYMQPRPSMEQSRAQSRAESLPSSRPGSRASSVTSASRNWLRSAAGGLRRKGSWNSFRSNRYDDDERERGRGREKGLDLNRSLPPLPGLDQYKAPKVHIAQLMALPPPTPPRLDSGAGVREGSRSPSHHRAVFENDSPRPHDPQWSRPRIPFSDDGQNDSSEHVGQVSRTLPASEKRQREMEMRRKAQGKLRRDNLYADEQKRVTNERGKLSDEEYANRQELELRRAVRDKMTQGALRGEEKREKEEDEFKRMARAKAKGLHGHNRFEGADRENPMDGGSEREWRRRLEKEAARSGTQGPDKRKQHEHSYAGKEREGREKRWEQMRVPIESEGPKRTLKNRLSRFLGGSGAAIQR